MAISRKSVPKPLQIRGRQLASAFGRLTADARCQPDFLLIGAQRCGTTSLFRAMMAHPQIRRPVLHKGVNYFDLNYHRGEHWYRGHFPLERVAKARTARYGAPCVFEASGYYMYHPLAPGRIAHDLPDVKLVVMLRNPVGRAYSAYQHELARGYEWETFETALDLEDERLSGELRRIGLDPTYESFSHRHHSYTRRGEYAGQLTRFIELFGREKLLIIESESFFADPGHEFNRLVSFLGIEPFMPARFDRYNARPAVSMSRHLQDRLEDHFAPHDKALASILGHAPAWLQ